MKTLTLGIVLLAVGGCKLADKVADDMRMQLGEVRAELRTVVDAKQSAGDKANQQAGGLNYASAFGTGAVLTVIGSIAAFVLLNLKAGASAEKRDEQSHLRELERIKHRNGSDKA